jgi:Zn-dependent protease with chaperone function
MSNIENASAPLIPFKRVHGETALYVISLVIGVLLWALLIAYGVYAFPSSLLVGVYLLLIAALYFGIRVAFITNVRGNGARLGPDQFPELAERVRVLSGRLGLKRIPAAYLIQEGGALNALAMRFIRTSFVVLYADLMDACGDNAAARDMIIAHELAHIRGWHVRLRWLLFPSLIVPFLGVALSRAREYTCDRTGFLAAGDRDGAILGLSILAVGKRYAAQLSPSSLVAQRRDLNTGWMTLGQWFATHPPLARRVAALDPSLSPETRSSAGGVLRALTIILVFLVLLVGGIYFGTRGALSSLGGLLGLSSNSYLDDSGSSDSSYMIPSDAEEQLATAFASVGAVLDAEVAAGRDLPESFDDLWAVWYDSHEDSMPVDPFDGQDLGYDRTDTGYRLWSSGPDGLPETEDDIVYDGPQG